MSSKDISEKIKLLVIFKTYLYLNGQSTAKQFSTWLADKELGLRNAYNGREVAGIIYSRRNSPICRPIKWTVNNDGIKEYYMRDTND